MKRKWLKKTFLGTYSRTSTLVVCIHHDLRTEKVQQYYSNFISFATATPGGGNMVVNSADFTCQLCLIFFLMLMK